MAAAAAAAARAALTSSLSRFSSRAPAANLTSRRGLAAGGDHHGAAKINIWEDPMSPSKWKEEHSFTTFHYHYCCFCPFHVHNEDFQRDLSDIIYHAMVCISQFKWMGFANLWWIQGLRWKEREGRGGCSSCALDSSTVTTRMLGNKAFLRRHASVFKETCPLWSKRS